MKTIACAAVIIENVATCSLSDSARQCAGRALSNGA
jgi:hypothetical protein